MCGSLAGGGVGLIGREFEIGTSGALSTTLAVLSKRIGLGVRFSTTGAGAGVSFGGVVAGFETSGAAAGLG